MYETKVLGDERSRTKDSLSDSNRFHSSYVSIVSNIEDRSRDNCNICFLWRSCNKVYLYGIICHSFSVQNNLSNSLHLSFAISGSASLSVTALNVRCILSNFCRKKSSMAMKMGAGEKYLLPKRLLKQLGLENRKAKTELKYTILIETLNKCNKCNLIILSKYWYTVHNND